MIAIGHPSEYRLIQEKGKIGEFYRLSPGMELPEGYEFVTHLYGKCIYHIDSGRLLEKFWAIRRWPQVKK